MKRAIVIITVVLTAIGGSGCMSMENKVANKAEELKDAALVYLNENYDDVFLPVRLRSKSWMDPYDLITFKSEKYNNREFSVYRYADNEFSDNYFTLQLEKEGQQYFEKILKEQSIEGSIKIGFFGDGRPEFLPRNPKFEDYIEYGTMSFTIYIFTEKKLDTEKRRAFIDVLVQNKFNPSIAFITTKISLSEVESYELDEMLGKAELLFIVKNSYSISVDFEIDEHSETKYKGGSD